MLFLLEGEAVGGGRILPPADSPQDECLYNLSLQTFTSLLSPLYSSSPLPKRFHGNDPVKEVGRAPAAPGTVHTAVKPPALPATMKQLLPEEACELRPLLCMEAGNGTRRRADQASCPESASMWLDHQTQHRGRRALQKLI